MSSRYVARLVGRQCIGAFHTQQLARSFTATTRHLDEKTTNSANKHLETKQVTVPRSGQHSSPDDKHDGQANNAMLSDYEKASTAHTTELMQLLEKRRALVWEHNQQNERLRDAHEISLESIEEEIQDVFERSSRVHAYISRSNGRARITGDDVERILGGIEEKVAAFSSLATFLWVSVGVLFGMWVVFGDWPSGSGFSQMEVAQAKMTAARAKEDATKAKGEASKAKLELAKLERKVCDATTKEEIMRLHTTASSFEGGRWSDWLFGTATIASSALLLSALLRKSS